MKTKLKALFEKYSAMSVTVRAGLWFTICGFLQKGISLLTTPIFTRLLTTEQYGIVAVYNSWESILSVIFTLNLFLGGFNNGMRDYKDRRDEYVSVIQGLITVMTVVWLGVYLLGRPLWNQIMEMSTLLVVVMFLQILTTAALSLWSAKERFVFRYKKLVTITLAKTCLGAALPIVTVLLSAPENGALARILTQAAVIIMICGAIYFVNLKAGKKFYDKQIWKSSFLFNLTLLPHYLSSIVLNQSDRIMISKIVGSSEAGIYSVAYSAGMILNIMVTAVNNSFAPWIYGELDNKRYHNVAIIANRLFALVALVLAALIVFAPECIMILAGRQYHDAISIIPPIATSLYFIFMYQIFANVEFYFKRNKFIVLASMSGAILNIILNSIGIRLFGYVAAAYTTLICYIIFGTAHFCFMKKVCDEELNGVKLFDGRTTFIIGFALLAFSVLMMALYENVVVRYALIFVACLFAYIKRGELLLFVKQLKRK